MMAAVVSGVGPPLASPSSGPQARGAALRSWIRALDAIKILERAPDTTLPSLLDGLAETHGDRPALLGDREQFSYRDLATRTTRYARWAIAQDFAQGDVVCLLMQNSPDYAAIWLGLTRAGCVVALMNTNLVADALLHSIRTAGSTRLIVSADLSSALASVADALPQGMQVWTQGDATTGGWPRLEPQVARQSSAPLLPTERNCPAAGDRALLVYTSGTTGQPKAATITHRRIVEWSFWFAGMMDVQPADRLYNCLPMYHSVGGIVAIGAVLVGGGSVLIRTKFSASRFWNDIIQHDCTIFQYIGELCRYLTASPTPSGPPGHKLRLACGNGLQEDVWISFQQRFAIPQILEFYAATEGSVSLYNCEGKPGAIGRVPPFLSGRFPIALIRADPNSGTPLRDQAGLCIACEPDEIGEAIGQVLDLPNAPARHFDGYTDPDATARKLLHDVFVRGDCWFRTGDLMRRDAAGFYYFVDRMGDTFRWRGENVATTEVASVVRGCPGVADAVVYGVTVPLHEGRAGMAAITTAAGFDFATLAAHLTARLPGYAQPLFVRLCQSLEVTGTFKPIKQKLAAEGYANTTDPIWFNDRKAGKFVICDAALLLAISNGTQRL